MTTKLDAGQKHLIRLVQKEAGADGWAPVSAQVLPVAEKILPQELIEIERVGDAGRGRARLTEMGSHLLEAMEWL